MKSGKDLGEIREDLRASARAFVDSFRSARLARVQIAFIAFNLMEWAAYVAIDVYAFYVVEHGEVEVVKDGGSVARLIDGDSIGEIALLRDVLRTATVPATKQTRLLVIERQDFLLALSGHPDAGRAAHDVAEERHQRGVPNDPAE
jgi:signal-transduction protein with cAMP-binding, CBS, and nucleotidyltransferase domain